jgi:tetratricopeptide (TPR) repeat protein
MNRILELGIAGLLMGIGSPLRAAPSQAPNPAPASAAIAQELLHGTQQEIEDFNARGIELAQKGELEKARAEFLKAVPIDPGNARTMNNLGSVAYQQKNWDEAIRYYEKALKRAPRYGDARYNLARALYHAGRYAESRNSAAAAQALGRDMKDLITKIDAKMAAEGNSAK